MPEAGRADGEEAQRAVSRKPAAHSWMAAARDASRAADATSLWRREKPNPAAEDV